MMLLFKFGISTFFLFEFVLDFSEIKSIDAIDYKDIILFCFISIRYFVEILDKIGYLYLKPKI